MKQKIEHHSWNVYSFLQILGPKLLITSFWLFAIFSSSQYFFLPEYNGHMVLCCRSCRWGCNNVSRLRTISFLFVVRGWPPSAWSDRGSLRLCRALVGWSLDARCFARDCVQKCISQRTSGRLWPSFHPMSEEMYGRDEENKRKKSQKTLISNAHIKVIFTL